jgi:hypothetical protein
MRAINILVYAAIAALVIALLPAALQIKAQAIRDCGWVGFIKGGEIAWALGLCKPKHYGEFSDLCENAGGHLAEGKSYCTFDDVLERRK